MIADVWKLLDVANTYIYIYVHIWEGPGGTFCVWDSGGAPYRFLCFWQAYRFVQHITLCKHIYAFWVGSDSFSKNFELNLKTWTV